MNTLWDLKWQVSFSLASAPNPQLNYTLVSQEQICLCFHLILLFGVLQFLKLFVVLTNHLGIMSTGLGLSSETDFVSPSSHDAIAAGLDNT